MKKRENGEKKRWKTDTNIVATETIHTLIGQLSVGQACNDLQWLL